MAGVRGVDSADSVNGPPIKAREATMGRKRRRKMCVCVRKDYHIAVVFVVDDVANV